MKRDGRWREGQRGERLAAEHLVGIGYQIIARNQYTRWGEIDLVALKKGHLCFVEVRSWRTAKFGDSAEWIPPKKLARMARLADAWTAEHGDVDFDEMTLGVVLIQWLKGEPDISFIADAIYGAK